MHLVSLLTGVIHVDNVVAILIKCIVQAAQQTLPEKRKRSVATLLQGILVLTQNIKLPKK